MTPQAVPAQLGNSNSIRKDTSISFKLSDLKDPVEFSIDGGWTWQDSSTFEDYIPEHRIISACGIKKLIPDVLD